MVEIVLVNVVVLRHHLQLGPLPRRSTLREGEDLVEGVSPSVKANCSLTFMTSLSTAQLSNGQFLNGEFTAPVDGYYFICISARHQDHQIEFTMRTNGERFCAAGSDVPDAPGVDSRW